MTNEETLKLRPGDWVEVLINGVYESRVVTQVEPNHHYATGDLVSVHVEVTRYGRTKTGRKRPSLRYNPGRLRPSAKYSATSGNVYADFLEEQGMLEAAKLLRNRFPLDRGD